MRVLLTGATGFLGYRTLEKLAESDHITEIIAIGRTLRPTHSVKHPKVIYQLGSLADASFVNQLTGDIDVLINAAALSSPWGKKEEFQEANVVSQQNLINLARRAKVKRFIYISSPSIYFNGENRMNIKETDPVPNKQINQYAATKLEAENLLIDSGIPYISLRPRALIGRGDTVIMPRLIRAFDEGKLKIIGGGQNVVDLTSVENVVDAILLSINSKEESLNHCYNISNGNPVALWETIRYTLGLMNRELGTKKVPFAVVKAYASLLEMASKLSGGKEPSLTVYGVGTLALSFTMDITKAQNLLGYQPAISIEQSIHEFVNWYNLHENS